MVSLETSRDLAVFGRAYPSLKEKCDIRVVPKA